MEILKVVEALQTYSEDAIAYKLDSQFANAVSEAVKLLIEQGEQIADLQNTMKDGIPEVRFLECSIDLKTRVPKMVVKIGQNKFSIPAPAVDAIPMEYAWIPGGKPPKEWKAENGDAINFLIVTAANRLIDIGNWVEPMGMWFCMGLPCTVTHWMPLPKMPKEVLE